MNSADKLASALRLAIKEMDWLPTSDETKRVWMRQQEAVIKLEEALAAHQAEQVPTPEDIDSQEWAGMDGTIAFHLIERHSENWGHAGRLMQAWRMAQPAHVPGCDTADAKKWRDLKALLSNDSVYLVQVFATHNGVKRNLSPAGLEWVVSKAAQVQEPRCALCGYQYGHAIGCENNPVDIAFKAMAPQQGGKT